MDFGKLTTVLQSYRVLVTAWLEN